VLELPQFINMSKEHHGGCEHQVGTPALNRMWAPLDFVVFNNVWIVVLRILTPCSLVGQGSHSAARPCVLFGPCISL
jgi:hypothetical protein